MDEILVKGSDGKWYIARDGKLIPQDDAASHAVAPKPAPTPAPSRPPAVRPVVASKPTPAPKPEVPKAPSVIDVVKQPEIVAPAPKPALPAAHAPHMETTDDMEQVIAKTVADAKLNFPDPSLTKRFKLLVASRLREVRRPDDVIALLQRDAKVGGLGLSEDDTARVAALIESAFTEFHKKWQQVEAERQAAVQKSREEAAKKTQEVMSGTVEPKPASVQAEKKPSLPTGVIQQTVEPFKKAPAKSVSPTVQKPSFKPPAVPKIAPAPAASMVKMPSINAPAVTDIRKPKLFGPADELREMRLADFRRMGSAHEAINRVKSKIEFIGSESLAKKREAIAAWKQSEVYALYTEMMGNAMGHGKTIDAEIAERSKSGKQGLTIDEIDAIMGLNEALRQ